MKLPDIKYESKHNNELRSYAIGWNTIVENTEYLCKEFGYEYAKENLLKNKDFAYEHMMMPFFKGQYDCIIEIERLNEEDELIAKYSLYDMFSYSLAVLDRLNIRGE